LYRLRRGFAPVTLAEFTLNNPVDYYDVSLVDGFNAPMSIIPRGYRSSRSTSSCQTIRCDSDLNQICPKALQVVNKAGDVVACMSACLAFTSPEYCCTDDFANPDKCKPTEYSRLFKNACPRAYSYAYDDPTSIYMCRGADYLINFC
ncbi:thaumatin-like protein, partial [Asparagus officinalis]|uniref:thaumatin-like protein n=1 Tax=Asparagus officinalis TaxID=4686 RepID=UPI00098E687C